MTDPTPKKPGRFERIRSNVQSANIEPGKADVPTKWAVDRIDERERRFSFAAAGGAALFGTVIYLAETQNQNFRLAKGQLTPQTTLTIGLIAAALLLAATFVGRRAPIGFICLFTFLAFGTYLFLGLPFLALAVWLLFRSYKIQRDAAANVRAGRAAMAGNGSGKSRAPAGEATTQQASRRQLKKGKGMPQGNKRYTPKRPAPPPPKPSRRDRKAAEAKD